MLSLRRKSNRLCGRYEVLEARFVLSASSLAEMALVSHVEQVAPHDHDDRVHDHELHDDELHGVDPYGNEYHAIPLVDYDRVGLNSYPDIGHRTQLHDLASTFHLHSNATATKTIFLDFTGYTTSGTYWNSSFNGGNDIVTAAYDFDGQAGFSDAELTRIQSIWSRVAEDFAPFDVNVTTADPGAADLANSYGGGDTEWGIRVVIGGDGSWYGSAGGVAYLNSFTWSSDTPVFVFENNLGNGHERYTAEAISHEVGHSLGLSHDGNSTTGYYTGHGSGATGWAPIMGVGYYQQLTQWSRGEYYDANNTQDDLAIITGGNGFDYRTDDHGDAGADATYLGTSGTAVSGNGIIERNTDVDTFRFSTTGGDVALTFDEAARGANLDLRVDLYDGTNQWIASSNPAGELGAALNLNLSAGDYTVHITGVGQGDPSGSGYSDYGSLGQYTISGNVDGLVGVDALAAAAADLTDSAEVGETGVDAGGTIEQAQPISSTTYMAHDDAFAGRHDVPHALPASPNSHFGHDVIAPRARIATFAGWSNGLSNEPSLKWLSDAGTGDDFLTDIDATLAECIFGQWAD